MQREAIERLSLALLLAIFLAIVALANDGQGGAPEDASTPPALTAQ